MPRTYRLGKRAAAVEATRKRIVQAALDLYQEQGITTTSMNDVARRADVATSTVTNHFPTTDDLARAAISELTRQLWLPTVDKIEEFDSMSQRIATLAREMALFYDRSEPWYRVSVREAGKVPALVEGERVFYGQLLDIIRSSLGPLRDDDQALSTVMALVQPQVFGALRSTGMSTEAAGERVAELLVPWLERRAGQDGQP